MSPRRKFNAGSGLLAVLTLTLSLFGCSEARDPWEDVEGEGPRVLVSFPPLDCFARNVAGEHAEVLSLLVTQGPHDYSPTPRDVLKAVKADLFLVNGLGLDDWITRVANSSGNRKLKVVKLGEAIPDDQLLHMAEHDHGHDHGHHHHGEHDPHVWLGIDQAVAMVGAIRDELSEAAPAHKETFAKNAANYVAELKKLQEEGKQAFAGVKNKKIVATHDSLGYFAKSFGLEVVDNIMPQPGVEASAGKLADLVKLCKKEGVRALTTEPQYSDSTAQTLKKQLDRELDQPVAVVPFDTLETADAGYDKDYYVRKMRENIKHLADALNQ